MTSHTTPLDRAASAVPPHLWFATSAVFHYLGPSFAVLLFPSVGVLGVAWMRIATAAAVFAPFTHPLRTFRRADVRTRVLLVALGACLAAMNTAFYLALDRLPMSLVAAIEFVGVIGIALYGTRTRRNLAALALAVAGLFLLIDVRWSNDPLGLSWAALNGVLFVVYVVLGHRAAEDGAGDGVERLGAAMAIAFLFVIPIGLLQALQALGSPRADPGRHCCRHLFVGHPLCMRPACHVAAAARHLRIAARAASGHGHDRGACRPRAGSDGPRRFGHRLGDGRRGVAPARRGGSMRGQVLTPSSARRSTQASSA